MRKYASGGVIEAARTAPSAKPLREAVLLAHLDLRPVLLLLP